MLFEDFLKRFQKEHHLSLTKDLYESSSALINEVPVHFKELNPSCFIMYTLICPIPPRDKEAFFEEVLKTNLYATQTEGMNFGIDEKTRSIVQFYRFEPIPPTYEDIVNKLKKFVAVAKHYKNIFEKK